MRKLKRTISAGLVGVLVASLVFAAPVTSFAGTRWSTDAVTFAETTASISVSRSGDTIVVTIPDGFDGEEIYVNATRMVADILGGIYYPGLSKTATLQVVNESGHEYGYVNNSFTMASLPNQQSSDAIGFDGNAILADNGEAIDRTGNEAIANLYGVAQGDILSTNVTTYVAETNLDARLKAGVVGGVLTGTTYPGGTADLNQYYLDYYNKINGTNIKRLENMSDSVIRSIFSGSASNAQWNFETNPEVMELGYDWFYNSCFTVRPASVAEDVSLHAIGAHMRACNNAAPSPMESVFRDSIASVAAGETQDLRDGIKLNIHGANTTNGFFGLGFGFAFGFKLQRIDPQAEVGNLLVHKIDESSTPIIDPAEFILSRETTAGTTEYLGASATWTTDRLQAKTFSTDHSIATFPDLEYGNYALIETKAPEGYLLDSTPIPVIIDQARVEINVINIADVDAEEPPITEPTTTTPTTATPTTTVSTGDTTPLLAVFTLATVVGAAVYALWRKRLVS